MMDYKKLGLRVGLEIHQQLDTKHKLFCNCPIKKSNEFPITIKRKLRIAAGELGEVDPAAVYEFLRKKAFVYRINPESSCLIEADDEPPKQLNKEALKTVIQILGILNRNRTCPVELEFTHKREYRAETEIKHYHIELSQDERCQSSIGLLMSRIERKG